MKTYEVYYRRKLIAEVVDYGEGFDAFLFSLNPEVEVKETNALRCLRFGLSKPTRQTED